ncbi:class I SAM-dependent methyltransferase [Methyloversatilis discipulorum]|uniref:class I SAM-dependent methyltransferase n=1 Tax=Methyloversatilis discipulorum TaxID=1119528 RepID=UPI001A36B32D|nr:SAM-dependent methyltransferase [Methyloversatilis discipulorum]MBL8467724.1 SAM-dependent methyltransferase [Methyloversatilis discipulorum]
MSLPQPDSDAIEHSQRLLGQIRDEIARTGWMPFSRYMECALYAPGLGYYSGALQKFGDDGDFVTAPELTPLFGRSLARQLAELMALSAPHLIEAGAGSGRLAVDVLAELDRLGAAPQSYRILELSADLRARQQALIAAELPHLSARVSWLDSLPDAFDGVVIGNEVLDAMPVERLRNAAGRIEQAGLALDPSGQPALDWRPAPAALADEAHALGFTDGYDSEINLAARAWVAEWAQHIGRGALLLIDYGFPQAEYYHPDRRSGTLMCHYRHHAHTDPLWMPGLNDLTAHVDFTAVAQAAFDAGMSLAGYTSQANFLLNCGVLELLDRDADALSRAKQNAALNQLTSPAEMGELFKVICMTRNIDAPLTGFSRGDRSHTL